MIEKDTWTERERERKMKNIERKSKKKKEIIADIQVLDVCESVCECQLIKDHESVTNLWLGFLSSNEISSDGSCVTCCCMLMVCERVEVEKGYRNYHACYKLPCSTSLLNWHRKCCVIFKLLMLLHLLYKDFLLWCSCDVMRGNFLIGMFTGRFRSRLKNKMQFHAGVKKIFLVLKYLHNMIMIKWNEMWEFLVSLENMPSKFV